MDSAAVRRSCFVEESNGLASIADMDAGVSGGSNLQHNHRPFFSRLLYTSATTLQRRGSSLRNLSTFSSSVSSPRSARFYDASRVEEHQPHFLDACFLCKKAIGGNKDIFMYRGDTPFCSEECRQEQIEMDEAKESWNHSASMKALRKDQKKTRSTSPNKTQNYPFRAGTVAAA